MNGKTLSYAEIADGSELRSDGRNTFPLVFSVRFSPPNPTVTKLKSFFRALICRISFTSPPKSIVWLPFVHVNPSRNSGTGTLRDWDDELKYGLEKGPEKPNKLG